jgi:surface protein
LWDSRALVAEGYNIQLRAEGLDHLCVTAEDLKKLFGKTMTDIADILLATVPVEEWHAQERACEPREISHGGRVKCNGEHEREVPITKVVILEDLIPRVCSGWFRDMLHLEKIDNMDKLHTHAVTDMSHMFAGCERLATVDFSSWDVSKVEDMTGMFDDCVALTQLPEWYN